MVTTAKRVYRKTSAEDRIKERHERLMQAALELYAKNGFANTTIEALCSEAKVTTRHFYQLFKGKEELLLELYNQIMDELQNTILQALMLAHNDIEEKARQVVRALITHYLTDTRRAKIGVLEVVGASTKVELRRREVIHNIAKHIELFISMLAQQNMIPQRNYHLIAVGLVGGVNELMAEWLITKQPDLEQLEQDMMFALQTLIRGVGQMTQQHETNKE